MLLTGLKVLRKTPINDLAAGLVMVIIPIPGSIANGVLAGVNPVFDI